MEKLHTIVHGSARQSVPSEGGWLGPPTVGDQGFASLPLHDSTSWGAPPTYTGRGRSLQQLDPPDVHASPTAETVVPGLAVSKRAYLQTMPYYLLPIFVGCIVAAVLLPMFLILFCLRNRKCSRR